MLEHFRFGGAAEIMAPTRPGKYEFKPESIVALRKRIGLSQAKMAEFLGVPANTLSRWETGATTPDADSLAAVYSVAMDRDVTPTFFHRRKPVPRPTKNRDRLIVIWDFQNYPASAIQVAHIDHSIRWELNRRIKGTSHELYSAFSNPSDSKATDRLLDLGWVVYAEDYDLDEEIIDQATRDSAENPTFTTLALVANDGNYVELIRDLKERGVDVYLFTSVFGFNERLVAEVGKKHWIRLPYSWIYTAMGRVSSVGNPRGIQRS